MRRVSAGALALAAVVVAGADGSAQDAQPQRPVIRASADAVSVDVAVQRNGRPVVGLSQADFELLDNGVPQAITEIAYERLPIDVTLLLDVSASVTGEVLDELRRALADVRRDLRAGDRLRLLTFNMRVQRLVDFDQPPQELDQTLTLLRGAGSSAVFDSLSVALAAREDPGRRRLIVLFSDGQDSSSNTDAATLLEVARRTTPAVAIILGAGTADRAPSLLRRHSLEGPSTVEDLFEQLASETGGVVTSVKKGENLSSGFRRMLRDFRSSYVLYFTPAGVERAGTHTLQVRVKRTGVDVRSRRGYVWQ